MTSTRYRVLLLSKGQIKPKGITGWKGTPNKADSEFKSQLLRTVSTGVFKSFKERGYTTTLGKLCYYCLV